MAGITKDQQILIDKKLQYVIQKQWMGYAKPRRVPKSPTQR